MGEYNAADTELDATGMRFAVAVARFNRDITEPLLDGARRTLAKYGAAERRCRLGARRVRAARSSRRRSRPAAPPTR